VCVCVCVMSHKFSHVSFDYDKGMSYSVKIWGSSVVWTWAMGWIIGGSRPGRSWEFFSSPPRPDRLWVHPSSYRMGTRGSFPREKAARA
jgi:hypothetical protein